MGEHRRLGILLGGVNDTMSNLVHSTDLPGLTGSAAGAAGMPLRRMQTLPRMVGGECDLMSRCSKAKK